MIHTLHWIESKETDPYKNLALEEYLTMNVQEGECILYLWQNRHTVVIGKNQNCWKECKVNFLEEEGGFLVRRLSGGGAVFHDMGNLNFTFMVRKEDYDVDRQLEVILRAVKLLGIRAEKTGRNDITVDGKKFSGNAFYESKGCCYHHGTLLLNVDKEFMSRYLNVDKEKLKSKSVDSVKSRVTNLCEYNESITVGLMKEKMLEAFGLVYGHEASPVEESRLDRQALASLEEKFGSWEWKYGRKIPFDDSMSRRFYWGDMELQFHVENGRIVNMNAYSDSMDQEFVSGIPQALTGLPYHEKDLAPALEGLAAGNKERQLMCADIKELIHEKI